MIRIRHLLLSLAILITLALVVTPIMAASVPTVKELAIKSALQKAYAAAKGYGFTCIVAVEINSKWDISDIKLLDAQEGDISSRLEFDYPNGPIDTSNPNPQSIVINGTDSKGNPADPVIAEVVKIDLDPPVIFWERCTSSSL